MAVASLTPTGKAPYLAAEFEEAGSVQIANGCSVYATGKNGTEAAVILLPDLWGWNGGRTRAIADHIARTLDVFVVVPQLLCEPPLRGGTDGDGMADSFDPETGGEELKKWLYNYLWESLQTKVNTALQLLRASGPAVEGEDPDKPAFPGAKRIGVCGMGFGTWLACYVAHKCGGDITVCAMLYPSINYLEGMNGGSGDELVKRVKCPCIFLPSGDDRVHEEKPSCYAEGGEIFEIVKCNAAATHHLAFPKMRYGWVTHGDVSDPDVMFEVEKGVAWATYFLRKFVWPLPVGANEATLRLRCKEGDSELIEELLKGSVPAGGMDAKDDGGLVPLHYAARWGHGQAIKLLLEAGADPNEVGGGGMESPLHTACDQGHAQAVKALLTGGAQENLTDVAGQTPIHYAARNGHTTIVRMLIKIKADVELGDTAGQRPMHLACWAGKTDTVICLLKGKAELDPEDIRSTVPQGRATQFGFSELSDLLDIERKQREEAAYQAEQVKKKEVKRQTTTAGPSLSALM